MRILCVDDDSNMLDIYGAMLGDFGHETVLCDTPVTALEHLEAQRFQVAIVDLLMPAMDGRELCRQIRAHEAREDWDHYTTIIVATALKETLDYVSAIEAGADDFLSKPLEPNILRARLVVADRVRGLRKELREERRFLSMCMQCRRVRNDGNRWVNVEEYMADHGGPTVSHGLCPGCAVIHYGHE